MAKLTITEKLPVPVTMIRTFVLEMDEVEATLVRSLVGRVSSSKAAQRIYDALIPARLSARKFRATVNGWDDRPNLLFLDPE